MKESISYHMELVDKFTGPSQKFINSAAGMDEALVSLNDSRQEVSLIKSDLEQYDRLKGRLNKHTESLNKAQEQTSALGKEVASTENPSKRQIAQFEKSRRSLEKLRSTNAKYVSDVHTLGSQLNKLGYSVTDMSLAHRKADAQLKKYDKKIIEHTNNVKEQSIQAELSASKEIRRQQRLDRANEYLELRKTRRLERENRIREGEALKHQMAIDRINRKMVANQSRIDSLNSMSSTAMDKGDGLGTTALAASGLFAGAMAAMTASNASVFEDNALATGYGMSYNEFKSNDFVAQQLGLNGEHIGDLSEELKNKLGEVFSVGSNGALDEFSDYVGGYDFSSLSGKSSQDQFLEISQAISNIQDSDKRQYFYDSIMGGEAAKLSQGMDKLGKNYIELYGEAEKYNLTTNEGVEGAKAYSMEMKRFGSIGSSAIAEFSGLMGAELSPIVNQASNDLAQFFLTNRSGIMEFVSSLGSGIGTAYSFITANAGTIATIAKLTAYVYGAYTAFKVVSVGIGLVTKAMALYRTGMVAAATAGGIFNAIMLANPIGLIAAGVAALGVGLYALYENWESIIGGIMDGIEWVTDALGFEDDDNEIKATKTINSNYAASPYAGGAKSYSSADTYQLSVEGGQNPEDTAKAVRSEIKRIEREKERKRRQVMYDSPMFGGSL